MKNNQFKGKRIDGMGWTFGYLIGNDVIVGDIVEFNEEYFNTEHWCKVIPETVGQYVFSNGSEDYYIGDQMAIICDCDCEYGCSHPSIKCELVWNEQYCQFGYQHGKNFELLDYYGDENIFKIGNRWDNPEFI